MSQRKGAQNLILEAETWQGEKQELRMRDGDPGDPVWQVSVGFQGFKDVSGGGKEIFPWSSTPSQFFSKVSCSN